MGKGARERAKRDARARDAARLRDDLVTQHSLLVQLGSAYDQGSTALALLLAVTIRVLVHDTGASHSLLKQMGQKSSMRFVDTAVAPKPGNLLQMHAGLALIRATMGVGSSWVPRSDVPLRPDIEAQPPIPFESWWTAMVTRSASGESWTRKRMVLDLANKEGGAHLDPVRPDNIRRLEDENAMGIGYDDPIVGNEPMANGPLLPSVRQIARELQASLEAHFDYLTS